MAVDKQSRFRAPLATRDSGGEMLRTEARREFWKRLGERAPHIVAELTDLSPAIQAIDRWPEHEMTCENARWAMLQAVGFMRNAPLAEHIQDLRDSEEIGPLLEWPIGHIDRWCAKYGLDSDDLRGDAFVTLTTNLYAGYLDYPPADPRPVLDPEEIPTSVTVFDTPSAIAEVELRLRNDAYLRRRLLFTEADVSALAALHWDDDEIRSAGTARLSDAVQAIFAAAVNRGTVTSPGVPYMHIDWFVRQRLQKHEAAAIAEDYQVRAASVYQAIRRVANLLGLPARTPGRPHVKLSLADGPA